MQIPAVDALSGLLLLDFLYISSPNKPMSHLLSLGHFFGLTGPPLTLGLESPGVQLHWSSPRCPSPRVSWQYTGFLLVAASSYLSARESRKQTWLPTCRGWGWSDPFLSSRTLGFWQQISITRRKERRVKETEKKTNQPKEAKNPIQWNVFPPVCRRSTYGPLGVPHWIIPPSAMCTPSAPGAKPMHRFVCWVQSQLPEEKLKTWATAPPLGQVSNRQPPKL